MTPKHHCLIINIVVLSFYNKVQYPDGVSGLGAFSVDFACLHDVGAGFLSMLWFSSRNMQPAELETMNCPIGT